MALHPYIYSMASERRALQIIYDYMKLDQLTMPECNLVNRSVPAEKWISYSAALDNIPASFDLFRRSVASNECDAVICVAGTESTDTRRVVFGYERKDKRFLLNFPLSKSLTRNEKTIRNWVDGACRCTVYDDSPTP